MSEVFGKIKKAINKFWLSLIGVYEIDDKKVNSHKCTCGRSSSGNCEGLHVLTQEQWNSRKEGTVVQLIKSGPKEKAKKPRKVKSTKQSNVVSIKEISAVNDSKKAKRTTKKTVAKPAKKTIK